MMELDLGLGPRQRDRALEGRRVVVLVGQVERLAARRRDQRPERDARRGSRRNPHAAAQAEDRIEHGADRVGERPAVHHGDRRPDLAPAPEEARAVGLELHVAHGLALHDGEVRRPDLGLAGRPPAPRRQEGADVGDELGLHEQLGEGGVRRVGGRRAPARPRRRRSARSPGRGFRGSRSTRGAPRHRPRERPPPRASSRSCRRAGRSRRDPRRTPPRSCPARRRSAGTRPTTHRRCARRAGRRTCPRRRRSRPRASA